MKRLQHNTKVKIFSNTSDCNGRIELVKGGYCKEFYGGKKVMRFWVIMLNRTTVGASLIGRHFWENQVQVVK